MSMEFQVERFFLSGESWLLDQHAGTSGTQDVAHFSLKEEQRYIKTVYSRSKPANGVCTPGAVIARGEGSAAYVSTDVGSSDAADNSA